MDKKFTGKQWFSIAKNTINESLFDAADANEERHGLGHGRTPAQIESLKKELMGKLTQQIKDLEPARDVRETYKDCLEAGCDPSQLEFILDHGVEDEDLHPYEGYYIMTGKQPADDFPGFDPSSDHGLKSEKVDEEGNWTPEDIQPGDSGLGPLDDEPYPIDAYGKALELGDIVNMEHDAEDYIVVHLDGLKVGIAEVGDALKVDAKDVYKA
jgi:hypothetical protein